MKHVSQKENRMRILIALCLMVICIGAIFRLWHITRSEFVFYDEGFYLGHNRFLGEMIRDRIPLNKDDVSQAVPIYLKTCLGSGKSLWFFLADLRIFFGNVYQWFWARVLAAVFGLIGLWVTFLFARKFYTERVAWIATAILAVLPSHVFYSRLGMQETLSLVLVVLGFYWYLSSVKLSWRAFASGAVLCLAFFSNYRLIVLPILLAAVEFWMVVARKEWGGLRRCVWSTVTFFSGVVLIGNAFDGINTYIIFSWIFHQQHLAGGAFHYINFLAYPYYLFRLESPVFFLITVCVVGRAFQRWNDPKSLPVFIALCYMVGFSLPEEKAARYICVILPFLAMGAADFLSDYVSSSRKSYRVLAKIIGVALLATCLVKSAAIASIRSSHEQAVGYIQQTAKNSQFLSSQKYVDSLYVRNPDDVKEIVPTFNGLAQMYSRGCAYMVFDPQVFLSYGNGGRKFELELMPFLEFVRLKVRPAVVFHHFSDVMMERFVFEHTDNLPQSLRFLKEAKANGWGNIAIYDMKDVVAAGIHVLEIQTRRMRDES